jgi:hypothetical protein
MKKKTPHEKLAEAARAIKFTDGLDARNAMSDVGDIISRLIAQHRAAVLLFELPEECAVKLVESQQALYAAMRVLEANDWSKKAN